MTQTTHYICLALLGLVVLCAGWSFSLCAQTSLTALDSMPEFPLSFVSIVSTLLAFLSLLVQQRTVVINTNPSPLRFLETAPAHNSSRERRYLLNRVFLL
jgi:hypothetical protein